MTKHATTCRRVFKNYDPDCPRCQELSSGAKPRQGWGQLAREQRERDIRWLREHNCKQAGCGPVCTFGDW